MKQNEKQRKHAIVLGGSMSGLFAARVLSDHFEHMTILERDEVHNEPESRKGQPQTRHLHAMLLPAQRFIQHYLPGVEESIIAGGALTGDMGVLHSGMMLPRK